MNINFIDIHTIVHIVSWILLPIFVRGAPDGLGRRSIGGYNGTFLLCPPLLHPHDRYRNAFLETFLFLSLSVRYLRRIRLHLVVFVSWNPVSPKSWQIPKRYRYQLQYIRSWIVLEWGRHLRAMCCRLWRVSPTVVWNSVGQVIDKSSSVMITFLCNFWLKGVLSLFLCLIFSE